MLRLRYISRITLIASGCILASLVGFLVFGGMAVHLDQFTDKVTLPNGMVLKRQFDWAGSERHDLIASDGSTVLARDIEFVCFNDRHVKAIAYPQGHGGLFDGRTNQLISAKDWDRYLEIYRASGLQGGRGCNGYYTGMVGPGFLYPGNSAPFLPICDWRNLENTSLADQSWFDRPCDDRPWPPRPGG